MVGRGCWGGFGGANDLWGRGCDGVDVGGDGLGEGGGGFEGGGEMEEVLLELGAEGGVGEEVGEAGDEALGGELALYKFL